MLSITGRHCLLSFLCQFPRRSYWVLGIELLMECVYFAFSLNFEYHWPLHSEGDGVSTLCTNIWLPPPKNLTTDSLLSTGSLSNNRNSQLTCFVCHIYIYIIYYSLRIKYAREKNMFFQIVANLQQFFKCTYWKK